MNKLIIFGTVILSVLAFSGYKAWAQLREENNNVNTENPKF